MNSSDSGSGRKQSFIQQFSSLINYNNQNNSYQNNQMSDSSSDNQSVQSFQSAKLTNKMNNLKVSSISSDRNQMKETSAADKNSKVLISSSTFHQSMAPSSMSELIPLMNRLQDVFSTVGHEQLDLPQIVVVGSQSSGKSSVLENIVQKDFLPRGKDIVTRRPLILQLVQLSSDNNECWAEFLHLPNEKFTDFQLVRQEIERETDRVCGLNKGISKLPINLRIYSNKVLNLTLVDLPGIMKVAIGDQPPDIEIRIKKLIMEFISKPNAIILAVTPANQDLVNSDALKLAKEVDPEGRRTIGVLTKLDLMDKGTNAYDIIMGKVYPLKLGFCAVVNRSQEDIINNKTVTKALNSETDFFKSHSVYKSIANKCGTPFLVKNLNMILMQHIKEKLPELKSRLNMLLIQTEQEILSYGDPFFHGKNHQGTLVLKLLTKFSNNFTQSIDGTYSELFTQELSGGARLYYIFNSIFGQTLSQIDPCSGLSVQDIRTAIRNSSGPRASLFIPEMAFDLLVKPQIKKLELPALRCVELVFDELLKIITTCENKELARFPKLHQKVVEVSVSLLKDRLMPAQSYIESLISIQMAYINTNHPDFIGGSAAIASIEKRQNKKKQEVERLKKQLQLNNGISFAQTGNLQNARTSSVEGERNISKMKYQNVRDIQIRSMSPAPSNTKDGGFLTYLFGNNDADANPRTQSRSVSPTRQMFNDDAIESITNRSDDGILSVVHPPEKEDLEVELIKSLITSYFSVTRKTIADLVPKAIMHLVVNFAKENIQSHLVTSLYKEDLFAELLMEDERIVAERSKCMALLETYRKGAALLQDIF